MEITAGLVKELRERSGVGMMECKKALVATSGDIEQAFEWLRKNGIAKAAKKATRVAAEGAIVLKQDDKSAVLVEVNSETDFVAKDDNFRDFAEKIASTVLKNRPADVAALMDMALDGGPDTVEAVRTQLVAKLGENLSVRRFVIVDRQGDRLGAYVHGSRIGVLVDVQGGDDTLAKDLAMHVAAASPRPVCVSEDQVPPELVAKEKEIYTAQAAESGKPPEIVEKMVMGKIKKFLNEISLNGQPFVKDPDTSVGKLLGKAGASVKSFVRLEVGEGIEKKVEDFAAEVMAQARGG
jgi:elongation factor Ts